MAARVNTRFVILLVGTLCTLVVAMGLFWFFFVHQNADELIARGDAYMSANQPRRAFEYYNKARMRRTGDPVLIGKTIAALRIAPVSDKVAADRAMGQILELTRRASELHLQDQQLQTDYYDLLLDLARKFSSVSYYARLSEVTQTRLQTEPDNIIARKFHGIAQIPQLSADLPREDQLQAMQDLLAAQQAFPQDAEVLFAIARWNLFEADRLDTAGGDRDKAQELRQTALDISTQMLEQSPGDLDRQIKHLSILFDPQVTRIEQAEALLKTIEQALLANPQPQQSVLQIVGMLTRVDHEPVQEQDNSNLTQGVQRAIHLLATAIEAEPDNVAYYTTLGQILSITGDKEGAMQAFRQVRQIDRAAPPLTFLLRREQYFVATLKLADLVLAQAAGADEQDRKALADEAIALHKEASQTAPDSAPVNLLAGKIAMLQGNIGEAAILLDKAAQQQSNVEGLLLASRAHRQLGNWGTASEYLTAVLQQRPDLDAVRTELAELHLQGGQVEQAQQQISLLRDRGVDNSDVQQLQASIFARQGKVDEAIALYQKLDVANNPKLLQAMARLYLLGNRRDEAVTLLEQRIAVEPNDVDALQLLVLMTQDPQQAKAYLEQARAAGAGSAAMAILEKRIAGEAFDAQALAQQLLQQEEDPAQQALMRAKLALQSNDAQKIKAAIAEAAKLSPDHPEVLDMQFTQALRDEDLDLAKQLAQRAGDLNADLAQGAFFQGRLAAAHGELTQAVGQYRKGLVARPIFSEGWRQLGDLLVRSSDMAAAADAYQTALKQRPNNVSALRGLASIRENQGRYAEALEHLRTAVQTSPQNAQLLNEYLTFEQMHGDVDRAIQIRSQLAQAQPNDLENQRQLALLYARQKQPEKAQQVVDSIVANQGVSRQTVYMQAAVHQLAGDTAAARQSIEQYIASRGQEVEAEDYALLGRFAMSVGDEQAGFKAYQQAMGLDDPETMAITSEFADLLFSRGAYEQSITLYEQLSKKYPDNQAIAVRLADAQVQAGQLEQAKQTLAGLDDQSSRGLALRAVIARQQGELETAGELIDQAIAASDGQQAVMYLERARLHANDPGRASAVLADLRKTLALEPALTPARELLAEVLLTQGEKAEAGKELRNLLERQPQHARARLALVNLLLETASSTDLRSAQVLVGEGAMLSPKDPLWPRAAAEVAAKAGDSAGVLGAWQQVVKLAATPANLAGYADVLLKAGQAEDVIALLREHAQVVQQTPMLQAMRGRALQATADKAAAGRVFEQALQQCQNPPQMLRVASQIELAQGLDAAVAAVQASPSLQPLSRGLVCAQLEVRALRYEQAQQRIAALQPLLAGESAQIQMLADQLLATSLHQQGKMDEARQVYERMLKANPQNVGVLNNLAFILVDYFGDAEAALPLAEQAVAAAPNSAQVLDTLGWVQFKADDVQAARATLHRSLAIEPMGANSLHLAMVYLELGDALRARGLLQQAVRLAEKANDEAVLLEANKMLAADTARHKEDVSP